MSGSGSAARRHDPVELGAGLAVIAILTGLILAAVLGSGRSQETGYTLTARFDHVDGLDIGSDVRLAGVKIGQVTHESVDPKGFQAVVRMTIRPQVKIPTDSALIVTSDSLLGGKYLSLSPGGADTTLPAGGTISQTQGAISLEQLLSKFIFSMTSKSGSGASPAPPAPAPGAPAPAGDDLPSH